MIKLLYSDIRELNDDEFQNQLQTLPTEMQADIERYRFMKDKKCRLVGRVMVRHFLQQNHFPADLKQWQVDANKKPFLPQAPPFNISHSGHMVLLAFAEHTIGVDVEREGNVDSNAIVHFFHPEEIEYYRAAEDQEKAFFNIWVRKEAFLKAVGTGTVEGLDTVSVLGDVISYHDQQWYIHKIDRWDGYQSALCSPNPVGGWWWKQFKW